MDMGAKKKEELRMLPKCLVHTSGRMELLVVRLEKNSFERGRFTLRCLLEMPEDKLRSRSIAIFYVKTGVPNEII